MKRPVLRLILALTILPVSKPQDIVVPMVGGQHARPAPAVTSLILNPGAVAGGDSATGTVTLNVAAPSPGGSTVELSSNNAAVQVTSVRVPAYSSLATFTVSTSPVAS